MTNRMKAKGDKYERDILELARRRGFPQAERTRPGRREDEGDIHLAPGVIAQCKDVAQARWNDWLGELEQQRLCARAEHGVLVVKRRGAGGRPATHLAVMPLDHMLRLLCDAGWGDWDAVHSEEAL
ncbi:RusA-like Holliday junction resolvase [Gordonia phage Asapag]|uniref:Holliday junction resolvase n=1 Tax=Gordonia phage Asapag TaxID=2507862 RepID=A0A410TDW4_9CAUD|nr:RusA-like Holliday junction resolvase [Gordonia phage Asapag]QAU07224.1 holliday junction resolvase [Gordonia phage Asapag]